MSRRPLNVGALIGILYVILGVVFLIRSDAPPVEVLEHMFDRLWSVLMM